MADTNELKPCPCGEIPKGLGITDGSQGGKYHYVSGYCCGEWTIEFRANYKPIESDECMALAVAAWNATPRALVAIREAIPPADAVTRELQALRSTLDEPSGRPTADAALADELDNIALAFDRNSQYATTMRKAASALRARPQAVAEGYAIAVPVGHLQCWENELNSAKTCIDSTLAWVSEYIKNHEDAKAMLAASQSATGGAK